MLNNVANTVENIANVLSHNARYEDALRMYERTLQARSSILLPAVVTAGSPLNGIVCRCNAVSSRAQCSAVQCTCRKLRCASIAHAPQR